MIGNRGRTSQGCECQVKFALMLSSLDFDSAIRGYLATPLALRFLGSRRNAGQGVVEGARRGPGAPRRSLHLSGGGRGGSRACGRRLQTAGCLSPASALPRALAPGATRYLGSDGEGDAGQLPGQAPHCHTSRLASGLASRSAPAGLSRRDLLAASLGWRRRAITLAFEG
jgi:hypothetical protein